MYKHTLYNKKEALSETGGGYLKMLSEQLQKYEDVSVEAGSVDQARLALFADQMGVDLGKTPEEERRSLLRLPGRSKFIRLFKKRK